MLPTNVHHIIVSRDYCCPSSCFPTSVLTVHQVVHVTLLGAEDVAVVVVRMGDIRAVVAVVSTPLISVTSIQASQVAVYRDQVVSGSTSAPEIGWMNSLSKVSHGSLSIVFCPSSLLYLSCQALAQKT